MRPSAVLTVAWLPLVLLYTDQKASALLLDSPVQIRSSQASKSCSPPVTTTRSVRFYSVKTAGGSLYVRHIVSQDLLDCYQAAGGAVIETARNFATCANTAEKKKKNVFQFANGVCTSYAAMPPSALLPSCSGVGVAVVYVVKTALNSATLPCRPAPKVTNIKLTANPRSVTASWTVQDWYNLTQSYMVTVQTDESSLVVSTAGAKIMDKAGIASTVIIPAGVMTYDIYGVPPCTNTYVTVTPQYSDGKDNGTSMTVNMRFMTPATITAPAFEGIAYSGATLDNSTIKWLFDGCESTTWYVVHYNNKDNIDTINPVPPYVTSLVLIGVEVCGFYSPFWVDALNMTHAIGATTGDIYPFGDSSTSPKPWPSRNGCYVIVPELLMNFTDALAYCSSEARGELFSYGDEPYHDLTYDIHSIPAAWVDLQYLPTTNKFMWGNGEEEPTSSSAWGTYQPNAEAGLCVYVDDTSGFKLKSTDCSELRSVMCFKLY